MHCKNNLKRIPEFKYEEMSNCNAHINAAVE
jgi:hypothetical protein